MRMKKGKYIILAALVGVAALGMTYAASVNVATFTEQFEMGKVGISLEQLTVTKDGEVAAAPDTVEPNKDVSYIPRFTCLNSDCYVRAKVEFIMDGQCNEPIGQECLYGVNEEWIKQGDYYYCRNIMAKGDVTDLFEGIHIPENWDAGEATGFSVKITAEAIQSDNFEPDFEEELPWGAIKLEELAVGNVCYKVATPVVNTAKLTYTSAGGFECGTEALFDEFMDVMPGDKCRKEVELTNKGDNTLRMALMLSSVESELTEKMTLRIFQGEEDLYYGLLSEAMKNEKVRLTDLAKGESSNIGIEIGVPVDAGNDYAEQMGSLVWELYGEELPEKVTVQTGDNKEMQPYAYVAILALLVAAGLIAYRRRES